MAESPKGSLPFPSWLSGETNLLLNFRGVFLLNIWVHNFKPQTAPSLSEKNSSIIFWIKMWPWGPAFFEVHDLLGPWAIHPRGWWCLYWTVEEREGCHAIGDWMVATVVIVSGFRHGTNQYFNMNMSQRNKSFLWIFLYGPMGRLYPFWGSHVFGGDSIPRFQNHRQTDRPRCVWLFNDGPSFLSVTISGLFGYTRC